MAQTYEETGELLARLWQVLWPQLQPVQRDQVLALPEPCHNHLRDRLRRPGRDRRLLAGCQRLAAFDSELLVEGLRLYPHAICRTAEAVGPLPDPQWQSLRRELSQHRLWEVSDPQGGEPAFWETVERLERHRELPQPILDFLESGRPREEAPFELYSGSLERFLVRAKLERMRFATYASIKGGSTPR